MAREGLGEFELAQVIGPVQTVRTPSRDKRIRYDAALLPKIDAAKQYNRNYGGELYDTDRRARVPYRAEPPKDGPGRR